jgi:RNA 2',3'-cyclic 3'-phosphodiesterase
MSDRLMRLFLALDIDAEVRRAVEAWTSAIRGELGRDADGLRTPRLDALHLTLHFLGSVDGAHANALGEALATPLPIPAFAASLGAVGTFPPRSSPRVVWVGLADGREQVLAIHEALQPRLQETGVLPAFEPRGYTPHLTLARLRPGAIRGGTLHRALEAVPPPRATWRVDHVTLYESDLSENRAKYAIRAKTALG